MLLTFE